MIAIGPSSADRLASGFATAGVRVLSVERAEPLPAGPLTTAALPDRVDVTLQSQGVELAALSNVRLTAASFALGDYRVDLDDLAGRVVLTHLDSPTVTTIWGDGRFQSGDMAEARFWGTVSLELEDGAFVTAGTAARLDNPDVYVLDRLTITKGVAALIVSGVGSLDADMTVAASLDGNRIEEATPDGLVLVDGGPVGWRQECGDRPADADYFARTAVGGDFRPDTNRWSGREFGRVVSVFNRILTYSFMQAPLSRINTQTNDALRDNARDDGRAIADRRAEERSRALSMAADHAARVIQPPRPAVGHLEA